MAYQRRNQRYLRPVPRNCPYCDHDTSPSYLDSESLTRYISERGKILAHTRTGICSKHQRQVGLAIKYARHLALLPFLTRVS